MEPCLQLSVLQTDLCCWGRRPQVPIELHTFCSTHAPLFLQYTVLSYFRHAAKTALFVATHDTFYIISKAHVDHYLVMAWKAKQATSTLAPTAVQPLHFRKKNSGLLLFESVVELLQSLPRFQLSCIIQTSLDSIDALRHVVVRLKSFSVSRLEFDPNLPAFVVSSASDGFVLPDVLSAPFVMLVNGSTTPDPRLYKSGTQSLWSTITGNKSAPLHKLRYGFLLQQTKNKEEENYEHPFAPFSSTSADAASEAKNNHEQFTCEL